MRRDIKRRNSNLGVCALLLLLLIYPVTLFSNQSENVQTDVKDIYVNACTHSRTHMQTLIKRIISIRQTVESTSRVSVYVCVSF